MMQSAKQHNPEKGRVRRAGAPLRTFGVAGLLLSAALARGAAAQQSNSVSNALTPPQFRVPAPASSGAQTTPAARQPAPAALPAPAVRQPPAAPASPAAPSAAAPSGTAPIALHLENADLLQVVGIIAGELHMNYVVDPQVKGTVNVNTLGAVRREDLFPLLQLILRVNGATAVQSGNFFRITPLQNISHIPVEPEEPGTELSPDDHVVMDVIPLRYVSAADMTKILTPFLSDGGSLFSHDAGNILILTDTSRSMKRLLELVAQFDTDVFASQRVRLFPVHSSEATLVAKELEKVFEGYGLSTNTSPIRFVPMDRISAILVVTANPSVYDEVQKWIERLDQPTVESGVRTFVYKVENSKASDLARVLSAIFLGTPGSASNAAAAAAPRLPGSMPGSALPGGMQAPPTVSPAQSGSGIYGSPAASSAGEETGSHIRIVSDDVNNQLVIEATAQEYEQMKEALRDLDVVPRQVMINVRVYEVDLTGDLSAGVSAYLQNNGGAVSVPGNVTQPQGSFAAPSGGGNAVLAASVGTLVGKTRQLLAFLNAEEDQSKARVISAPSILASDNEPASINVGESIPVLTSQAVAGGVQVSGSSVFTNTIQNISTGVLLTITPRINSSGLVHLQIDQEVSSPLPVTGPIQSPSIEQRSISTQVVLEDGETLALGGIIQDSKTVTKNRIPLLGDIPYLGALFGNTSVSNQKTELIILLTPTVIRTPADAMRATAELRDKVKDLREAMEEEEQNNSGPVPPVRGK